MDEDDSLPEQVGNSFLMLNNSNHKRANTSIDTIINKHNPINTYEKKLQEYMQERRSTESKHEISLVDDGDQIDNNSSFFGSSAEAMVVKETLMGETSVKSVEGYPRDANISIYRPRQLQ